MQTLTTSTRGLALLFSLNWDRLIVLGVLVVSLVFSAWIAGN